MYSSESNTFINPLPGVPLVESPFFDRLIDTGGFDEETRRIAHDLNKYGFAVIDFPEPVFNRLAQSIKSNLLQHFDFDHWHSIGHQAGISLRVQDAWQFDENVRQIACNKHVLALLSRLFGRQAWPFQTLNFPVGTQQHFHTDSIHFSSVPERFMCGVWVALEDINDENGPLEYFPGSHKWPIYTNEHVRRCVTEIGGTQTQAAYEPMWRALVEASGLTPQRFYARTGQALIWLANLLHGGTRQVDKHQTRWSQVTHYFFEDCAYYTPMMSDPFYGSIDFRELRNISTGNVVPQKYAGNAIPSMLIGMTNPTARFWADDFDGERYLQANPDVAASGTNPAEHYLQHGLRENRKLRP